MIIHVFGLCSKQEPKIAEQVLKYALKYLNEDSGVCLWDRSITYLGLLGATNTELATKAFPLLQKTLNKLLNPSLLAASQFGLA